MATVHRFAAGVTCACGRVNDLLLPVAECGSEFVWHLRCGGCGAFAWFHAREDAAFGRAIRETAKRRGEMEGLSEEGTREAHAEFARSLPRCACGGSWHVVRRVEDEPCLGCGRPLRFAQWPDPTLKRKVAIPNITADS